VLSFVSFVSDMIMIGASSALQAMWWSASRQLPLRSPLLCRTSITSAGAAAHCLLFLLRHYAAVVAEFALGCRAVVVAGVCLLACLLPVVVLALGCLLRLLGGLVPYL
jgi:hypothetical protein